MSNELCGQSSVRACRQETVICKLDLIHTFFCPHFSNCDAGRWRPRSLSSSQICLNQFTSGHGFMRSGSNLWRSGFRPVSEGSGILWFLFCLQYPFKQCGLINEMICEMLQTLLSGWFYQEAASPSPLQMFNLWFHYKSLFLKSWKCEQIHSSPTNLLKYLLSPQHRAVYIQVVTKQKIRETNVSFLHDSLFKSNLLFMNSTCESQ